MSYCGRALARNQHGFTLVEVVVALVIIAMAGITIVGVMSSAAERSAEATQRIQAGNIADAYMREILSRPFADPDGVQGGEATRATFDDVNDYDIVNDNGARDRFGNAIAGLDAYQISVDVVAAALNVVPAAQSIPAAQSRLITVTVTSPSQFVTELRGYKTAHP